MVRTINLLVPRMRWIWTSLLLDKYFITINRQPSISRNHSLYFQISTCIPQPAVALLHSPSHFPERKMEEYLQIIEDAGFPDYLRVIFNLLKATLQYPTANPRLTAAKLADDINFICQAEDRPGGIPNVILWVWSEVIDLATCIPPDHPWQDALVQAVENLRQREGAVPGGPLLWEHLPDLALRMRESWDDPAATNIEVEKREYDQWKYLNSFAARLTTPSFFPWFAFPIWQLRTALEEPPVKGAIQECRVWVACEWIIRCGKVILDEMRLSLSEGNESGNALLTGSLCGDDISQLGDERWDFWKKRLGEIAADAENLKLESAIVERISDTLKIMDAVQK
ncbi:hypothetical protein F4779DRAFT_597146 [Xylariaceae sp. FL0662B]|nr:hypothetical protein F4779DRAFT_597146 [Xylariaceae sp. FL0662B]